MLLLGVVISSFLEESFPGKRVQEKMKSDVYFTHVIAHKVHTLTILYYCTQRYDM